MGMGLLPRKVKVVLQIGEATTMPIDEEEEANRLIDQILDLRKTLNDLTSRMHGAWKFPISGLIKNTLLK